MAKQFANLSSRAQLGTAQAQAQLDDPLLVQPDTVQIVSWLSRLHLLYGIPFNYLVPDIRMLPDESIRFFQVDENWITALIDGAFSPGATIATSSFSQAMQPQVQAYVNENLSAVRSAMLNEEPGGSSPGDLSGFFLRSSVVSGWPGMEITGYSDTAGEQPLQILRMERLSPTLLLCLFNGIVARVEMSEPAETLHFAFNLTNVNYGGVDAVTDDTYFKNLRYVNSEGDVTAGSATGAQLQISVLENKVVKVHALAGSMQQLTWAPGTPQSEQVLTSAEFALTMVQNTDFVTFEINS
jgi:hypothetical protein